jgi:hypothetical protein
MWAIAENTTMYKNSVITTANKAREALIEKAQLRPRTIK